jgi:hypothetical protein
MTGNAGKRPLPPIPHPDHLRKQAKTRLLAMRAKMPAARLADAQATIAREYGFENWAALQTEVARRVQSPQGQWRQVRKAHLAPFRPGWWHGNGSDEEEVETLAGFLRAALVVQAGFLVVVMIGLALIVWVLHQRGLLPSFPIYLNL